MDIMELQDVNV